MIGKLGARIDDAISQGDYRKAEAEAINPKSNLIQDNWRDLVRNKEHNHKDNLTNLGKPNLKDLMGKIIQVHKADNN